MKTAVRAEVVDEAIDAYVEWREECLFLVDAYNRWSSEADRDRRLAFAAYRAALDREQQACSVYKSRCDRLTRELTPGRGPIGRLLRRRLQPRPAAWSSPG
jgi:hypothetical protein